MNAFFDHKTSKRWKWKNSNGVTQYKIDFILSNKLIIVMNLAVLNNLKSIK